MSAKLVVGIDLGTTHCAMAVAALEHESGAVEVVGVPQLVALGEVAARPLLPSFVYFAHESEAALALPWDAERRFVVGELARSRGAEAPERVIASAKSWLSHGAVDRRGGILPLHAPSDIEKISPVEASFRLLDHLNEAFRASRPQAGDLSEQEVVLTVPASFDAGARDLTVEAALAAGFDQVTLLEEPQAALYAWIEGNGEAWRDHLRAGERVLVIDIGGGTTDFSLIDAVEDAAGTLELQRVAVGDHILLGGDNMDLALAHVVAQELAAAGKELDRHQLGALAHACRGAKEKLLGDSALDQVAVVLPSRGSQLLGGTIRGELRREQVEQYLLQGFFPSVASTEAPRVRPRAGLLQAGLPYASDPAITKHLAAFLQRHALSGPSGRPPSAVLFNGGVLKAPLLRARLLESLNGWLAELGAPAARVLPGEDLDLAVARGAAYYGLVRHGRGLRIRGGTARAYYVGIESPMPALPGLEPPVSALCVAPFGMEEGTRAELPPQELFVVVGEPVTFRFFGSSTRRDDVAGTVLDHWQPSQLQELPAIELTLPPAGRAAGDVVAVNLQASVTAIGTLKLEAVAREPLTADERWEVELSVRHPASGA